MPAAVIATVDNRDSIPQAGVSDLTPLQKHGRDLFGGAAQCKNCHTLAAASTVATVGPNLDQLRPPYSLVLNTIQTGRANGNGAMAADLVQGKDAQAVAAFVAAAVNQPVPANVAEQAALTPPGASDPGVAPLSAPHTRRELRSAGREFPRKLRDVFPSDPDSHNAS